MIVRLEMQTGILANKIKLEQFIGGYETNTPEEVAQANKDLNRMKWEWKWYEHAVKYLESLLIAPEELLLKKGAHKRVTKQLMQYHDAREKDGDEKEVKLMRSLIRQMKADGIGCSV